VLYLSTPSTPEVREAMTNGLIGCMTTPAQGNIIPAGAWYGCDNGKYGKGWPGGERWYAWLKATITRYGPERCLWAVAPDVPFDAAATLAESRTWFARMHELGVPVAFAAQNGSELPGMIPWDDIDVLFLAGDTEWKIGEHAAELAHVAKLRGLKVHMGRVNSEKRFRIAMAFGCDFADGTCLARAPRIYLSRIVDQWHGNLPRRQPPHVELPLPGMPK
jgi:hypothetical protein